MNLDLNKLFIISMTIAIAGSAISGVIAAAIEQKILGKADTANIFRQLRVNVQIATLIAASAAGYAASYLSPEHNDQAVFHPIFIGCVAGIIIHILLYTLSYSALLNFRD